MCIVNCVSCCRWRMRTFVWIVLEVVVSVICCGEEGFIFSQRAKRAMLSHGRVPRCEGASPPASQPHPLHLMRQVRLKDNKPIRHRGYTDRFIRSLRPQPQSTAAALMILPR